MSALARIARWMVVFVALCCTQIASAQRGAAEKSPNSEIGAVATSLVKAFNAHDANAMASHWQEDGVHTSAATGEKLQGRKALTAAYRKLFAADPKCQLALRVLSVRKLAADVVSADVVSAIRHTDGKITRSTLNAVLVERDGEWWISQVLETDIPDGETSGAPLAALDWLAGSWSDNIDAARASNEYTWSHNAHFLTSHFHLNRDNEHVRGGTQMFGWDPVKRTIRCWIFIDDGTFGEGVCTSEGTNKWVTKLALTLADGRSGAITQVIERVGPDEFTIQSIDRELDGAPQPNGAVVTMVRQAGSVQAEGFGGAGQGGGGGFF